jgi:hypothetical protein
MDHKNTPIQEKRRLFRAALSPFAKIVLLVLVLAVLVGNAAAGLAGGLARGLALAAAAVLGALAEVAGFEGLDLDHGFASVFIVFWRDYSMLFPGSQDRAGAFSRGCRRKNPEKKKTAQKACGESV